MIYVHVPFCHRKCTYCAFYSKPLVYSSPLAKLGFPSPKIGEELVDSYVDGVLEEMERRKGEQAHRIKTVYFGGGTPSILPIGQLGRIVDGLHGCFDLSEVEEMTLEANPEDLTPDYLAALVGMGFNRLSIGVQSLDDKVLRMLNRRHTAQQAVEAVESARRAGFGNISVDFIYGTGTIGAMGDIGGVISMVEHVSVYALTVEAGTALAVQVEKGRVAMPSDEEVVRQYHELHDRLEAEGFRQYEVSNYARPGFESKHNSRYWNRTPYLGLGPGAHSFDGVRRRWNNSDGSVGEETLTDADAYNEMLMTALRTTEGLPVGAVVMDRMQRFVDNGWIVVEEGRYRPTTEGLLHADGMAAELFV